MLGLGETEKEIFETMDDLLNVNCKIMTIGQYLQPSKNHLSVSEYVNPEKFNYYKEVALSKGFDFVESAPLVRSSYHAEKQVILH
jgi:lipoic acid synthetase